MKVPVALAPLVLISSSLPVSPPQTITRDSARGLHLKRTGLVKGSGRFINDNNIGMCWK